MSYNIVNVDRQRYGQNKNRFVTERENISINHPYCQSEALYHDPVVSSLKLKNSHNSNRTENYDLNSVFKSIELTSPKSNDFDKSFSNEGQLWKYKYLDLEGSIIKLQSEKIQSDKLINDLRKENGILKSKLENEKSENHSLRKIITENMDQLQENKDIIIELKEKLQKSDITERNHESLKINLSHLNYLKKIQSTQLDNASTNDIHLKSKLKSLGNDYLRLYKAYDTEKMKSVGSVSNIDSTETISSSYKRPSKLAF